MIFTGAANLNRMDNWSGLSQTFKEGRSEKQTKQDIVCRDPSQYVFYCGAHVFNLVSKYSFVETSEAEELCFFFFSPVALKVRLTSMA